MSLIRPELRARIYRWREVLVSLAVAGFGVWVFFLGGYFFGALGLLICGVAIGSGVIAARRLRFDAQGDTPGLIEVTEGQITYMSATGGGVAARSEITQIDLFFTVSGRAWWRIFQTQYPPVAIPLGAQGSDDLFDAFVALPGARPKMFLSVLDRAPVDGQITVWRRDAALALT